MHRKRSSPHTFDQRLSAEKARLEEQLNNATQEEQREAKTARARNSLSDGQVDGIGRTAASVLGSRATDALRERHSGSRSGLSVLFGFEPGLQNLLASRFSDRNEAFGPSAQPEVRSKVQC